MTGKHVKNDVSMFDGSAAAAVLQLNKAVALYFD